MKFRCKLVSDGFFNTCLGRISLPYLSAYNSSKYAAEAFSDSLRLEVKPWGVSVHIIEPTFYKTRIINEERRMFTKFWDEQPQETKDEITETQFKSCKYTIFIGLLFFNAFEVRVERCNGTLIGSKKCNSSYLYQCMREGQVERCNSLKPTYVKTDSHLTNLSDVRKKILFLSSLV